MSTPGAPDPGLCGHCRHRVHQESTKGSSFLRCGLADERADFKRYPPLPVLACRGYADAPDEPVIQ